VTQNKFNRPNLQHQYGPALIRSYAQFSDQKVFILTSGEGEVVNFKVHEAASLCLSEAPNSPTNTIQEVIRSLDSNATQRSAFDFLVSWLAERVMGLQWSRGHMPLSSRNINH